jgi:hypothetical protein
MVRVTQRRIAIEVVDSNCRYDSVVLLQTYYYPSSSLTSPVPTNCLTWHSWKDGTDKFNLSKMLNATGDMKIKHQGLKKF